MRRPFGVGRLYRLTVSGVTAIVVQNSKEQTRYNLKMKRTILLLLIVLSTGLLRTVRAQGVAVWTVGDRKWKHWLLQPEASYWFCDRFAGHFVGAHLLGGQYNAGNIHNSLNFLGTDFSVLTDHRYQGWAVGAGLAYGYSWIIDRHWNIEAEIGLGWVYTRYDVYPCANCGTKVASDKAHNYVGPTKAAINLIYTF